MKFILVVDRKHLFPGLSPQGLLPVDGIDLPAVERNAFFAEREYMEHCSHYKQIIPYIALLRGDEVLCYQRQAKHSEQRLGGLWTIGFGGHVEPIDRDAPDLHEVGLLRGAALRELAEETGLDVGPDSLLPRGYVNSEANDVSTVHFGVLYSASLDHVGLDRDEIAERVQAQAEPHRVEWRRLAELTARKDGGVNALVAGGIAPAPHGGEWESWTVIALPALATGGASPSPG